MSELKMPAINQVALSGRVVQDPDYRLLENGVGRLSARLALNRSFRNRDGEWQEEASFINVVAWEKLADFAANRLQRGTAVFVSDRLHSHSWRDDDDNPHSVVDVQVRSLQVLEKNADNGHEMQAAEEDGESEETDQLELVDA
jgi:single-strand DNA-binding protein